MNVTSVLEPIIQRDITAPGDYTGEDGLLYCGKCHTPKQTRGTGLLAGKLLPIPCACQMQEREDEEARERRKRVEELRERCLPIKGMHAHIFAAASDAKHIQLARRYVEKWDELRAKNTGLLFWGNTGTGKSFTAHCIANALIDREVPVRLYSAVDLVRRLTDRDKRDETIQKVRTVPLLILDDVGAERDTDFAREQLCAVIDDRAESGKPLIVTTNFSLDEMKSSTDKEMQRIFDRLGALCVPVSVTGESRRKEIGAQKLREAREILGA